MKSLAGEPPRNTGKITRNFGIIVRIQYIIYVTYRIWVNRLFK